MGAGEFFDYPTSEPESERDVTTDMQETSASPFLEDADEREWDALLAFTQTRNVYAGEAVFAEGDTDHALYLLTGGRLELRAGDERLAELEAPASLNEIAFLDRGLCAVTAIALTESELARLSFDAFESLAAREPVLARKLLLDVGRVVARGLREV